MGGALFGGVGAVVGGVTGKRKSRPICDSLKIKITLKSISLPTAYITFINSSIKKDTYTYRSYFKSAQDCLSILQLICSSETEQDKNAVNNAPINQSNADEILKFKQLLDAGIITQEEFESKKKQLLGI